MNLIHGNIVQKSNLWVFCGNKWSVLWDWVQIRPWCLCWSGSGLWLWVDGLSVFLFIPTEQLGPVTCEFHLSICLSPSHSCLTVISLRCWVNDEAERTEIQTHDTRTRSISQRPAQFALRTRDQFENLTVNVFNFGGECRNQWLNGSFSLKAVCLGFNMIQILTFFYWDLPK